MLFRLTLG